MRDRIFALLGVETGEGSMVSTLLSQSVFLGIFFGAFDISAHSLFLSVFDEKMMARAYVVSGLAGIILTSLYTWLQTRMKFRNFAVINLFAVTLFTLILWSLLVISPSKWVVFLVFIMLGPLNILAMLGFWGTTGRLFSLRQGKRLFGLVDSGLIIGIILSCYTIPVLLSFRFESHNILLLSSFSVFIASAIQIAIRKKFILNSTKTEKPAEKESEEKSSGKKNIISVFRHDSYTRTMAIFVALSVITAFFVQYSFMAVTREQYPAEADMAKFLGIFTGSMMIFTLLVKLLVFSYIIRNYGLKTCLAVSPVLIASFTAIAIMVGLSMGYSAESVNGFIIFFLLLALSRLFSKSLKDSIESPSFKVIYQTIDEKIRYKIQSGMDGTVNEIAALSSGLLLAGLGMLSFIKLIHFSIVLLFIILAWISVAILLYSEYRKSIRKALESFGQSKEKTANDEKLHDNRYSVEQAFRNDYFNLIKGDFSSLADPGRKKYLEFLIDYTFKENDLNLVPALKIIGTGEMYDADLKKKSLKIAGEVQARTNYPRSDKTAAARDILAGNRVPQTSEILRLLRDNSVESRRFGLFIIGKFRVAEMLNEVCECLNLPSLHTDAISVLKSFGDEAAGNLIRFYMASGSTNSGKSALKLIGGIHNNESRTFLFSRLWANSRNVKELAVRCLINAGFKPSPEEKDKLHQLISEIIGLITWNISAKVCLEKNNIQFLTEKINRETARWKTFLFDVLSITYEPGSIKKIKENLEAGTVESGNFALEMIDIVIDETIKPKLIALLDVIPDENKVKNLYHFFPGEIPSPMALHEDIINRDYNLISLWTKVCALKNLESVETGSMAESAAALLFSPEYLLQEESARLISRSDIEQYRAVASRIPDFTKERLDKVVNGETDSRDLLYEKTVFLARHFNQVPEEELLPLAGSMIYATDLKRETRELHAGCIVWPVDSSDQWKEAYVMYNGERVKNILPEKTPCYILTFDSVGEYQSQNPEMSSEILAYINENEE